MTCSLGELVTYIAYLTQQARHEAKLVRDEEVPRVTIMTAFRAKGLEFPIVLVPDCKEPLYKIRENPDRAAAEEERRIFYVALTRAKKELHLIVDSAEPTPFLTAIAHERLVHAHSRLNELLNRDAASLNAKETFELAELLQFYRHEAFIQLWFDVEKRGRLLKRFEALGQQLEQADSFHGQRETVKQLSLERYAYHAPLQLAEDTALEHFTDVPALVKAQNERHMPKQPQTQPFTSRDALGRESGQSGTALGPSQVRIGKRVRHNKLGKGMIVSMEGKGDQTDVEVRFDSGTVKKLRVIYANLFSS